MFRQLSKAGKCWQAFLIKGGNTGFGAEDSSVPLEALSPLVLWLLRRSVVLSFSTGMSSEVGLCLRLQWKPTASRCLRFAADSVLK